MPQLLIAVAFALVVGLGACARPEERSDVVWDKADNPKVAAAIAEAQRTLPVFWRRFDVKPAGVDELYLKVPFKTAHGGQEHMWIEPVRRSATEIVGRLVDEPEDVPGMKPGDEVRFPPTRISDWTYAKGSKNYGHFSTRALLDQFGPEVRDYAASHLSATPLEAEDQ